MSRQVTNGISCKCPESVIQELSAAARAAVSRAGGNSSKTRATREASTSRNVAKSSQQRARSRNGRDDGDGNLGSNGDAPGPGRQPKNGLVPTQSDSWGNVLKRQSSTEALSTFKRFDPLRTIHFLGKELQSLLKSQLPHDSSVFEVLVEMQNAIKRVPRDIESIAIAARRKQEYDLEPTKLTSVYTSTTQAKTTGRNQGCQTPDVWYMAPDKLQQHLSESSEKIQLACQQMEFMCSILKSEKECVEQQLVQEKEVSKRLAQQIDEHRLNHQAAKSLIDTLKLRVEELELELQQQQVQLASQRSPSIVELSALIEQLQGSKAALSEENVILKQKLQISMLEIDKYDAILQARDMQVREIRQEMNELQEVVREQLFEFHCHSSVEDMTTPGNSNSGHLWHELRSTSAPKTTTDSVYESILSDPNDQQQSVHSECLIEDEVQRKRHVYNLSADDLTSMKLRFIFSDLEQEAPNQLF